MRQPGARRDDRRAAAEDDERRNQGERHLGHEDRLPRDQLREQAADRGPERRAGHAGGGPDAHGPALAAGQRGQQLERRAHRRRAADALHGARPDQERERRRERAGRRGRGEEHEAAGAHLPGGPARGQASRRHGRERDRQVEGRDDPGDVGDLRVVLAVDRRQREDDDRGVGQHEPDGQRDRRDPQVRSGASYASGRRWASDGTCARTRASASWSQSATITPCPSGACASTVPQGSTIIERP